MVGLSVGGRLNVRDIGRCQGRPAISVPPDCRMPVIGPASASRCKVGLFVFHWLLPSLCDWLKVSFVSWWFDPELIKIIGRKKNQMLSLDDSLQYPKPSYLPNPRWNLHS